MRKCILLFCVCSLFLAMTTGLWAATSPAGSCEAPSVEPNEPADTFQAIPEPATVALLGLGGLLLIRLKKPLKAKGA